MKNVFLILLSCFVFYSCQTPKPEPKPEPQSRSEDRVTHEQLNKMILDAFEKYYQYETPQLPQY